MLSDQIRYGYMIHDPADRFRKLLPYAGRLAEGLSGTAAASLFPAVVQAGRRIQRALRQAQDLPHRIVLRGVRKAVSALGASDALDESRLVQDRYDLFQIFFRYSLAFCDLPGLHIFSLSVQGKIQHHSDRIPASGRNSHGTHSVFLNYGNYSS